MSQHIESVIYIVFSCYHMFPTAGLRSHLFNINKSIVQIQQIVTHSAVLGCVLEYQRDG